MHSTNIIGLSYFFQLDNSSTRLLDSRSPKKADSSDPRDQRCRGARSVAMVDLSGLLKPLDGKVWE